MTKQKKTVGLENPWTSAVANENYWTWEQVASWCKKNVHENDRKAWLSEAREAFEDEDGATLGKMIIGS